MVCFLQFGHRLSMFTQFHERSARIPGSALNAPDFLQEVDPGRPSESGPSSRPAGNRKRRVEERLGGVFANLLCVLLVNRLIGIAAGFDRDVTGFELGQTVAAMPS